MSKSGKNASRSLKLSPPRSLMNLEDAEEIWMIITKRYPKAAPLLCEMELVLDRAENLLEQLKSSCDLGIELSTEKSLDVSEFEETISETTNKCKHTVSKNVEFNTPEILKTQEYNFNYLPSTETVFTAEKNNEVSLTTKDPKTISTSCSSTYTVGEIDFFFNETPKDTKEYLNKSNPQHLEGFTQNCMVSRGLINNSTQTNNSIVKENQDSRPSSASKNLRSTTGLILFPKRPGTPNEATKIIKKAIPKVKGSRIKHTNGSEESISHFKKVIETIRCKEESCQIVEKTKNLKNDIETQERLKELGEIIEIKVADTASIDAWDKVVGNSSKTSEILQLVDILKLANDVRDAKMPLDRLPIKQDDVFSKLTKIPLALEANNKIHLKKECLQRDKKETQDQECVDKSISISSAHESPVTILEQYGKACNKPVDYSTKDDRKGKVEITCNFAKYKVSTCGKRQDVVKNEASARMLHMLATNQMEENIVGDLQEFSRQQILAIMKLDKGDSFIPITAKRMTMIKLYTFCLEQNLPEPKYEVTPDKQYGFSSICKVLVYIGKGVGRLDGNAKEKAAEDLYKRHFQKLKYGSKGH